jgi:hypothetical protein
MELPLASFGNIILGAVKIARTNVRLISLGNGDDDQIPASFFYARNIIFLNKPMPV